MTAHPLPWLPRVLLLPPALPRVNAGAQPSPCYGGVHRGYTRCRLQHSVPVRCYCVTYFLTFLLFLTQYNAFELLFNRHISRHAYIVSCDRCLNAFTLCLVMGVSTHSLCVLRWVSQRMDCVSQCGSVLTYSDRVSAPFGVLGYTPTTRDVT